MNEWFKTNQGIQISHCFAEEMSYFIERLRGECLLQLGVCGENSWLPSLQYEKKWIVSPVPNQAGAHLTADFNQLPLDRLSVDCIIAPLSIETFSIDKNPLDEFDRILKPMGYIVFFGINPSSLWGIALRLGWLTLFGKEKSKLHSFFFVKHSAFSRGYQQCVLNTFYYIPPVKSKKWLNRLEFLNEMGKMLWLYPAGFYCLIIQKQQIITPELLKEVRENNFLPYVDNSIA